MTYTYTPQAGDVIESPWKTLRHIVVGTDPKHTTYKVARRRCWIGPWHTDDGLYGGPQIHSTSHFSALVGGMGWKLIARRDQ